ncbi:MAG: class I SAM-dependent methyltransferase [Magnetococcales bacterium]|nr:class I SAM-dependent methyltransferase [Magnetococcales bacterium]
MIVTAFSDLQPIRDKAPIWSSIEAGISSLGVSERGGAMVNGIPCWSWEILACPETGRPLRAEGMRLLTDDGTLAGYIEEGVVILPLPEHDPSIEFYQSIDGTRFQERIGIPYTMSHLDTPVYHHYLRQLAPQDRNALVVDVGGGDGRNALPWLHWGFERVVVIDPIPASLRRLRQRLALDHPVWMDRLLLIVADARRLPLAAGSAQRVIAIEVLYYLNETYAAGLAEMVRITAVGGQLLVAERDYEGALLSLLLYGGGVDGLLGLGPGRDVWDILHNRQVRSRCFTREEILTEVRSQGLEVLEVKGISSLSILLGFLRHLDRLGDGSGGRLAEVEDLLRNLGETGHALRVHVIVAARLSAAASLAA